MTTSLESICKSPKILAIMPTRACPAACRHCGSFSSPKAKGRLDRAVMIDAITQAAELDFKLIAFTGGEATLEWETLLTGIKLAHSFGIKSRLVTNAHWADSGERARIAMASLKDAGLNEINCSTGDEHAKFVPVDNVIRGIVAALDAGYTVQVMVEYRAVREITKTSLLNHADLASRADRARVEIIESPWMPLTPTRLEQYPPGDTVDAQNVHIRSGCSSILQTYTVEPEGSIGACCGLGMGHIQELYVAYTEGHHYLRSAVENAESDFLKLWIRYKGPEKILAWAANKNPNIKWEGMYAHNCQACQRLYRDPLVIRTIQENYEEIISDVIESAAFDEVIFPQAMQSQRSPLAPNA